MANNQLLVNEKQQNLGNFIVGRLLPFRKKRQIGPFTFIDHMGPSTLKQGQYLDVDQHPHIGLSTLTYLYKGQIEHRDSTGSIQIIRPGDVGFMTAGKGVSHTERTPEELRNDKPISIHGYQIWVALPKDKEEIDPHFQFFNANRLPHWKTNEIEFTLVAGNGFGKKSPLQGYSPMFMVDIFSLKKNTLDIKDQLEGEIAFVIVKGGVTIENKEIGAGQMLISQTENACSITFQPNTQILLFGGQALKDEVFLMWNFVSSDKTKLKKAKEKWILKQFPKVPGDNTYISYPNV